MATMDELSAGIFYLRISVIGQNFPATIDRGLCEYQLACGDHPGAAIGQDEAWGLRFVNSDSDAEFVCFDCVEAFEGLALVKA